MDVSIIIFILHHYPAQVRILSNLSSIPGQVGQALNPQRKQKHDPTVKYGILAFWQFGFFIFSGSGFQQSIMTPLSSFKYPDGKIDDLMNITMF